MRRALLAATAAALLVAALVPATVAAATTYSETFQSDRTWTAYSDSGLQTSLGAAQPVCLNASDPNTGAYASGCPSGATNYGWSGSGAWTANLSSAPSAYWIWAPGVTGETNTSTDQFVYFSKTFTLAGPATGGSISIAADNAAEVFLNGTSVYVLGDISGTSSGSTTTFNAPAAPVTVPLPAGDFVAGTNVITVYGVNGSYSQPTYAGNPAGVVFYGTIDGTVDTAPVVTSVTAAPTPAAIGTDVTINANYTDPDSPDSHTATIDCGNGTTLSGSDVSVTEPSSTGEGTVTGTCTYASAALYTVTVTVTDAYGESGSGTTTAVVYDPSAGFVTGGGRITDSTGSSNNFGFVAKYQSGGTMPVGSLEYQHAGGNFHAKSFSYLVVSSGTATLAGSGTLDGVSGYSFVLTVTDNPDQFAITISGPNSYSYSSSTALAPISKGSIQIHS